NRDEATAAVEELRHSDYSVAAVTTKEVAERPQPPFRTSTLQRAAAARLGFSAAKTMMVAQQLYEGVDLGEGPVGLITYMRTDSTRISAEARAAATRFIEATFGTEYVGPGTRGRAAKGAQDAHEAIRPTDVSRSPDQVASYLSADQLKLYRLIWQRFVASQMAPALYDQTTVDIAAGRYELRATARVMKFPGWRTVYGVGEGDDEAQDPKAGDNGNGDGGGAGNGQVGDADVGSADAGPGDYDLGKAGTSKGPRGDQNNAEANGEVFSDRLPALSTGEPLVLLYLVASQHWTQAPPRFTQGTLVAELERYGIGRPSTYAPTLETLRQRHYVRSAGRYLVPTSLGIAVYDFLMEYFPHVMDLQFTARMEEQLDAVEQGEADWVQVLQEFYDQFVQWLQEAQNSEPRVIKGQQCPECGGRLVERFSRFGRFASCENYPDCKYTRDVGWPIGEQCPECGRELQVVLTRQGRLVVKCPAAECGYMRDAEQAPAGGQGDGSDGDHQTAKAAPKCEECGADMALKRGPRGRRFWGCTRYPDCTYTQPVAHQTRRRKAPVKTGLECPECGGELVVRWGKRGPFLGCSGFPRCRFTRNLTSEEKEKFLPQSTEMPPGAENPEMGEGGSADGTE
ncbi:MAG: DNA topoisomerase, partial [Armatimonadetes bacterium]|nr:DNA topoisomerase [Armatimonadota bacterium]